MQGVRYKSRSACDKRGLTAAGWWVVGSFCRYASLYAPYLRPQVGNLGLYKQNPPARVSISLVRVGGLCFCSRDF